MQDAMSCCCFFSATTFWATAPRVSRQVGHAAETPPPFPPNLPSHGPHPTLPMVPIIPPIHGSCATLAAIPNLPNHDRHPTVPVLPGHRSPSCHWHWPPSHHQHTIPPLHPGYAGPAGAAERPGTPTLIEDPVNVEAVRGTGLVVEAPLHVPAERLSPGVLDHPGVGGADLVWGGSRGVRRGSSRPHPCGAGPTPPAHPGCPPAPGPPHWCPGSR